MGIKNDLNSEYQKAVKAGEFEGSFEQYLYSQGITGFSEGQAVRGDTPVTRLSGSYKNWTEVARAQYAGHGLSEHELTVLALQMQDMNPGTNVFAPGTTINMPDISAAGGTISHERWAEQKAREQLTRGETPTMYRWGEGGGPTQEYWATQSGVEQTGGAAAGVQEQANQIGQDAPATQDMSIQARAWNAFFGNAYGGGQALGMGSASALGPQAYYSGAGTTYVGPGYDQHTDVTQVRPPTGGEMMQALQAAFGEDWEYGPAVLSESTPYTRPGAETEETRERGRTYLGSTVEQIADTVAASLAQYAPDAWAALDLDDTSAFTPEQVATLVTLGIYDPPQGYTMPPQGEVKSRYQYYNYMANAKRPPGMEQLPPQFQNYYLWNLFYGR